METTMNFWTYAAAHPWLAWPMAVLMVFLVGGFAIAAINALASAVVKVLPSPPATATLERVAEPLRERDPAWELFLHAPEVPHWFQPVDKAMPTLCLKDPDAAAAAEDWLANEHPSGEAVPDHVADYAHSRNLWQQEVAEHESAEMVRLVRWRLRYALALASRWKQAKGGEA